MGSQAGPAGVAAYEAREGGPYFVEIKNRGSKKRACFWYTIYNAGPKPFPMTALADATVATLRKEILSGNLPPGTKLAEAPVAKRLGVSRVPVREALVILANEGLVQFKDTGRSFVKCLSKIDFEEIYAMRMVLEPVAARRAAANLGAHKALLEKNIQETAAATSVAQVTELDLDFHELILRASGNSRLLRSWRALRPELQLWLGSLHRQREVLLHDVRPKTVSSHRDLLNSLVSGSPDECEALMQRHIQGWKQWIPAEPLAAPPITGRPRKKLKT
jgi:DNA-binding GntR family transcriptional regulator